MLQLQHDLSLQNHAVIGLPLGSNGIAQVSCNFPTILNCGQNRDSAHSLDRSGVNGALKFFLLKARIQMSGEALVHVLTVTCAFLSW